MAIELPAPADWRRVRLVDLGEVNRGRSRHRPRHEPRLYGGKYPFIQTGDIKASRGRITSFLQTYSEGASRDAVMCCELEICMHARRANS